jgi:hypothetical protein
MYYMIVALQLVQKLAPLELDVVAAADAPNHQMVKEMPAGPPAGTVRRRSSAAGPKANQATRQSSASHATERMQLEQTHGPGWVMHTDPENMQMRAASVARAHVKVDPQVRDAVLWHTRSKGPGSSMPFSMCACS